MAALPYKSSEQSKKNQVEEMFDKISPRYDLLNHLLSVNIDKVWRKKAIKRLSVRKPETILDVATGTADFAIAAMKINPSKVTGIDISEGMLGKGREKVARNGWSQKIELVKADSENIPFEDSSFDAAVVGFGVSNFKNLEKGLSEILRVLKPGGFFMVLEFSKPKKTPFRQIFYFYFVKVLPVLGRLISKDKNAYRYLPESVNEFPDGDDFIAVLKRVGFWNFSWFPQTFGIASVYEAQKQKTKGEYNNL